MRSLLIMDDKWQQLEEKSGSEQDLLDILGFINNNNIKSLVIGGGSNLLLSE